MLQKSKVVCFSVVLFIFLIIIHLFQTQKTPSNPEGTDSLSDENIPPQITSPITKEVLRGSFRCNKYTFKEGGVDVPTNTMMATCRLENICLTTSGEFVLFQPTDRIVAADIDLEKLNSEPWVYTQGRAYTTRGNFHVRVVDGDLQAQYTTQGVESLSMRTSINETFHYTPLSLHERFSIISQPVYALKRYASGNVGHNLLQNINMVISLMMNYKADVRPSRLLENSILYLDDVFEIDGDDGMASFGYSGEKSDRYSTQVAGLVSNNPVLQLCRKEQGYSVEHAPCRNVAKNTFQKPEGMVLQTCFKEFYAGMSTDLLIWYLIGREPNFLKLRQVAYERVKVQPMPSEEENYPFFLKQKDVVVTIHFKSKQEHHGGTISNSVELMDYMKERLGNESFLKELGSQVRVEFVNLGSMTIAEQVKYFSNVDVYITDQGSAVYYAMFMRDDTALFVAPWCDPKCRTGFTPLLESMSHVRVKGILDLTREEFMCEKRPTPGFDGNCDPIVPIEKLYHAVVSTLKTRYRKFFNI